jgi:outer membrane immunogenic protein
MKKFIVEGITTAAFFGAPALAADLPTKAPPRAYVAPAPLFNWTGCYIGGNVGGVWSHKDINWVSEVEGPAPGPLIPSEPRGSQTASGWAYGGQVGCDYQLNNNWVLGIRGMWDGSNATGSSNIPLPNFGNFPTGQTDQNKIRSFETLTGRIGFLVNPAVMLYGEGGVAWVQNHFSSTQAGFGEIISGSNSQIGYDIGAGVSWMFAPHWELFVEYEYMGFGSHTFTVSGQGTFVGFAEGLAQKQNLDKVLVGLNYRLDPWGKAPVVAKY